MADDCALFIVAGGVRPSALTQHLPFLSHTKRTPLIALASAMPSTSLASAVHGQFSSASAALSVAQAEASSAQRAPARTPARVLLPTLIAIGFRVCWVHPFPSHLTSLRLVMLTSLFINALFALRWW
jgi:hypothetical protein